MDRNHLKGRDGDRINAAPGHNFTLLMRGWRRLLRALFQAWLSSRAALSSRPAALAKLLKAKAPHAEDGRRFPVKLPLQERRPIIRGELAIGREASRRSLVFGWTLGSSRP
jgi:hypothetical protein